MTENFPTAVGDPTELIFAEEKILIDVQELSRLLSVSPRTIWRLVSAGRIVPPVRIGGSVRWRLDDVKQWINAGCPTPEEEET